MVKESNNIKNLQNSYLINIQERKGDSHFIAKTITISDPNKKGLQVWLSYDKSGKLSAFDTDMFQFSRFNVAEGFTPRELEQAVRLVLSGRLDVSRSIFGKYRLTFHFGDRVAVGKLKFPSRRMNLASSFSDIKSGYSRVKSDLA